MNCEKNFKKNKILFVAFDKFPPFRVDVVVLFGKELVKRGFEFDYLLQSEKDNKKFYITDWMNSKAYVGATNNGNNIFERLHKHFLDLQNDFRMRSVFKKNGYDCILVRDKFFSAVIALIITKISKKKCIYWLSFPFPESDIYGFKNGSARYPLLCLIRGIFYNIILYKIVIPNSDHVFVQSDQMKENIIKKGFSEKKFTSVPMGIDLEDFNTIKKNCKNINNSIIYIGAMDKIRRMDFLLRVFKIVLKEIPSAKLIMVGGSSDQKDLEELKLEAEIMGIHHRVFFTGNLNRKQALEIVRSADIGISPIMPNPIYIPSSPTKILEYMLMKKPVIGNDIPEQRKIIFDSKAGYCVRYEENLFAKGIIKLIKNPDKAKRMGKRGGDYVRLNRNYTAIANVVEKQLNKVLS
jgi:glycosyltransferase involved in cell wall biosynthesis